ncbi:MAG: metallophosphoesterase [Clostridia bacterium]|nr:metallophosphoesterase [Clostridia bacterium]
MKEKVKKSKGKKFLKGLLIFFCVIAILVGICTVINAVGCRANTQKAKSFEKVAYTDQLVPVQGEDGNWVFNTDKELKILQLTDIHIGAGFLSLKKDAMALNAVASMVTAEKPDLVIVTGDIGYPVPFQSGTFNNRVPAKMFAELMDTLGVYWTFTFGNHDTEAYSFFDREYISEIYSSDEYEYCIFTEGPDDVDGYGNQIINVVNSKGLITQSLYLFDSHSYTDGDYFGALWKYDNIHQNQIDWYKNNVLHYNKINAEKATSLGLSEDSSKVNSLLFFHIPLTEYKDAWYEYADNGFKDTENVKLYFGTAGESKKVIYCGIGDDELFETVQELGSTKGIFCGHDHYNNFSLDYKGIRLTYGMSVDYLAYIGIAKVGSQRGCTVIDVLPDGSFDCHPESYYQDKYNTLYEKEAVTMQEVVPVEITEPAK